jgi:hypothetical protein
MFVRDLTPCRRSRPDIDGTAHLVVRDLHHAIQMISGK